MRSKLENPSLKSLMVSVDVKHHERKRSRRSRIPPSATHLKPENLVSHNSYVVCSTTVHSIQTHRRTKIRAPLIGIEPLPSHTCMQSVSVCQHSSKHWTRKQHRSIKSNKCPSATSHFSQLNSCLCVVVLTLIKRITPKICVLCFVVINSVLLNLFRV